ncbi:MAG: hypothetical protein C4315_05805 [Chloroflexota bacterium]
MSSQLPVVTRSPAEYLGIPVGEDRVLADWPQVVDYFRYLASVAPCVRVRELGRSTEGNPFIVAIISSEHNLNRLDHYRWIQQRLADPRGLDPADAEHLIAEGRAVVLMTCGIHATEVGSTQMAVELAYELATGTNLRAKEILENVILLLVPSLNPDGLNLVADWYRRTLDTPYEGTSPPQLYHKYCGHDNNRDWFMFTQVETRLTVEHLHNAWHPHIVYDLHQMAVNGPRMFLPPYIDPIDPNVDPILIQEINALGMAMAAELTAQGKAGVVTNAIFDAWSPSRAYQHYHGGVRILSEAASCRIASPVTVKFEELTEILGFDPKVSAWNHPLVWPGGTWRLRDVMDYQKVATYALLTHAARNRREWVRNFYLVSKRAVERTDPPYAFIVPPDQHDPILTFELLETLEFAQVEIYRARAPFEADRTTYPAGTWVIPLAQPYGAFAKTMLEAQRYPDLRQYPGGPPKPPYDLPAHSLPLQFGVNVVQVEGRFEADLQRVERVTRPVGCIKGGPATRGYLLPAAVKATAVAINRLLAEGFRVWRTRRTVVVDGEELPPGTWVVLQAPGLEQFLPPLISELGLTVHALDAALDVEGYEVRPPRLGVYRSWRPTTDEGWTRFVLERYGFPYRTLLDRDIRQGRLRQDFDAIILPSQSARGILQGNSPREYPPEYCGGLGEPGMAALRDFVAAGGTLIALDRACDAAIQALWLPVRNVLQGVKPDRFYCPGSILRILVDPTHPVAYGYRREETGIFVNSPAFEVQQGTVVAHYPLANPLLAGWILGPEHLYNRAAVVEVPLGKGRVILLGLPVQFRAQARGTYNFLFNSIYRATSIPTVIH